MYIYILPSMYNIIILSGDDMNYAEETHSVSDLGYGCFPRQQQKTKR